MPGKMLRFIALGPARTIGLLLLAAALFVKPSLVADDKPSPEQEAKASAQCAEAEGLLRSGKAREARDLLTPLLKDQRLFQSQSYGRLLYYHGFACFLLKDYFAAGQSLSRLAPFTAPGYGSHARYLLARLHHLEDERAEAAVQYESVLANHEALRNNTAEALKEQDKLKPEEKTKLEALVNGPPPEHVTRAGFFLGLLHYEGGRFPDAQARFADFVARSPQSPFVAEAQFYQACCAVHQRQFAEAIQMLQALAEKEPSLAGPALLWLGKAQAASAEAEDEDEYQPTLRRAMATLRRAAEKSGKDNQGDALLELADVCQLADQAGEAAALYGRILDRRLLPQREEEVLARCVTALVRAGLADEADKAAAKFEQNYPKSLLLPEVLFRRAESALRRKDGAGVDDAARLCRLVAGKYPEFVHAQHARLGLARTHYLKGEWDKAREALETIPQAERTGELAVASFLLADCLLHLAPAKADDALAAGRLQEQLGAAATLLTDFAADNSNSPLAAGALLRLGLCQQRLAAVMAQEEERKKLFEAARSGYERVLLEYPRHELGPVAAFMRARCIAQAGDSNEAIKRLQAFATGALKKEPIAPLAELFLAELIGAQENKAADAARILTQCRRLHEAALRADPARAAWVPLLQYRHGAALMEAGQFDEARAVFEQLRRLAPKRVEGVEATLCWGQALREGGAQLIDKANQMQANSNLPAADRQRATKDIERGQSMVREAARYFEDQAEQWKGKEQGGDIRARLLYEAIWMHRAQANDEQATARARIQEERRTQRQQQIDKLTPEGEQAPTIPPPDVPAAEVPIQPAEQKARALYQALLDEFPDLPLAHALRLELGELLAERGEWAPAVKLFAEALDKEPPSELSDKLRLRLATCHAARGDTRAALGLLEPMARGPENPFAGQAHWRAAECLIQQGNLEAAVQRLAVFRDQEAFQNLPGVSDAALVRLGYVLGRLGKWEQSRNAHAMALSRFGDGAWTLEARLGLGWGWQRQKDYAKALEVYGQIPLDPPTETTARARILIGVCKVAQEQYAEAVDALVAVPANHDVPDLCAFALVEAAHALARTGQQEEVAKLLRRAAETYPKSGWAEVARERLRDVTETPPHDLPAAVALLAPTGAAWKPASAPPPLEMLGQQQSVRAMLEEVMEERCQSVILSRKPTEQSEPAPFLRLALPDPFEHHRVIPLRIANAEEGLPEK
jgi:TolA-binding protein